MEILYEQQELWELKSKLSNIIIQLLDDPHYEKQDAALAVAKIIDRMDCGNPSKSFEEMVGEQYAESKRSQGAVRLSEINQLRYV